MNSLISLHFEHITHKLNEYAEKSLELEKWRRHWNQKISLEQKGYKMGQIHPKTLILRFMVVPGFSKEIRNLSRKLAPQFEKVEYRIIRPEKEDFLVKNKTKTGSYKWKTKPEISHIDQNTKIAPDQTNKSKVSDIIERERRWYSEEDRKSMEKFYQNIHPNRFPRASPGSLPLQLNTQLS